MKTLCHIITAIAIAAVSACISAGLLSSAKATAAAAEQGDSFMYDVVI